jgi:hypothetical protein
MNIKLKIHCIYNQNIDLKRKSENFQTLNYENYIKR